MNQGLTLGQYIRKRNGVPLGASGSLRNMLYRSLGAGTFAQFWRFWNPIFSFYLGKYIFKPLKLVLPSFMSLIITFVICGALHDVVSLLAGGRIVFFFTPWFTFMGTLVVISNVLNINYATMPWVGRATINLLFISSCLALTIYLQPYFRQYIPAY